MATTNGKQGFANMSVEDRRAIASKGGKAAHDKGTGHEWSSEEAREAGRKGGEKSARIKAEKKLAAATLDA